MERGAYGIGPESRLFMLWGHAHLLGSGWKGRVRERRVRLQDLAVGYRRHPALGRVFVERVDDLERTVAGKTRMIVRR